MKTLKKEEVYLNQSQNVEEARASLGYLPPTEFEAQFTKEQITAYLALTNKI